MTEDERYIKEIEEQFEIRHLGGLIPDELPTDFFIPIDDE